MAFGDLDAVATHVGLAQRVSDAFTLRVGALANSIGLMAALPVSVVQRGIAAARVITQPFVAARPQAQPPTPEVAEVSRNATPLGAVQVGTVWRICRRIVFTRNGRLWADTEARDVDPNAPAPAPPPPPQAQPPQQGGGAALAVTKHKFSAYIDQADETEFLEADPGQVEVWSIDHDQGVGLSLEACHQ